MMKCLMNDLLCSPTITLESELQHKLEPSLESTSLVKGVKMRGNKLKRLSSGCQVLK